MYCKRTEKMQNADKKRKKRKRRGVENVRGNYVNERNGR